MVKTFVITVVYSISNKLGRKNDARNAINKKEEKESEEEKRRKGSRVEGEGRVKEEEKTNKDE